MKRLFSLVLAAVVVTMAIWSCKDDFNEQDFLKLQSDLKIKQDSILRARSKVALDSANQQEIQSYVNALNAAGELMSLTLLITENNVPVPGVAVTVTSGPAETVSGGKTSAVYTGTTDAAGNLVLPKVTIGHNTFLMTKAGYVPVTAIVDFGPPNPPEKVTTTVVTNGVTSTKTTWIPPAKRFEAIGFPFFSNTTSATSTAKVDGVVTIQSNLLTKAEEIPQNITVTADFSALTAQASGSTTASVNVVSYKLEDGTLGTATVDNTTGAFSMIVPASNTSYTLNLIFPTIEVQQTMAVAFQDGTAIATGPEIRTNVPTVFGPNAGTYDNIPQIYGAKVVLGTPPPPGRGFSATFAAVSRGLGTNEITADGQSTFNSITWNIGSRGRGFTSSPTVTITGGGGSGAAAGTRLRGRILTAQVTAGGSGYANNTAYDVQFTYVDANGSQVAIPGVASIDVTSSGTGDIPLANLTLPGAGVGYSSDFFTSAGISSFGARIVNDGTSVEATSTTKAVIAYTRDVELHSVLFTNGGTGYTSAPTVTLSAGGGTQPAVFTLDLFRTQYDITLGTTQTTPYKVTPQDFIFTYAGNNVDGQFIENPAKVNPIAQSITQPAGNQNLISLLKTDGTILSRINPDLSLRTTTFWATAPTMSQIDRTTTQAVAFANVSASTGVISSVENPSTGVFATDAVGAGYDAFPFSVVPSATGAPGTGAVVTPTLTTNGTTKLVTWSGASTVVSGGSGFTDELNQGSPGAGASAPLVAVSPFSVTAGKTYKVTFKYGSGRRTINVTGNFR